MVLNVMLRSCTPVLLIAVALTFGFSAVARATTYVLPADGGRLIGKIQYVTAKEKDTLLDIARHFDVGFREIVLANPDVDVWLPGEGTRVLIPTRFILPDTPHRGVVVNVPEMRLYYYPKPKPGKSAKVMTVPISIGRQDWSTPLGLTKVRAKVKDPAWYPPASIRAEHAAKGDPLPSVVPAGPDNPLGQYALALALPGYLIHGTNKPYGIGMRVSHGCIRLYPEDIKSLFKQVPRGAQVRLIDQPYKAAWYDGRLYMSAQPLQGVDSVPAPGDLSKEALLPESLAKLMRVLGRMTYLSGYEVNWDAAEHQAQLYNGIPSPVPMIGQPAPKKMAATR